MSKHAVTAWLPVAQSDRLRELAKAEGKDAGRLVADLILPFLEADEDIVVIPLKLHRDTYDELVAKVERALACETDEDREGLLREGLIGDIDEEPVAEDEISGAIETSLIYAWLTAGGPGC